MQLQMFTSQSNAMRKRMSQTFDKEKEVRERERDLTLKHKQDLETKRNLVKQTSVVV